MGIQLMQIAAVILLVCGCLHAVTITPLPYKGNEPGYRLPRGTATFLDQDEGNRIRRQMLSGQGMPGFFGGNEYDSEDRRGGYDRYDRRSGYDNYDRYNGNEIDRDPYYERKSRDYYPNYNPEGSSTNRKEYDCEPRGGPNRGFHGGGGYNNWGSRGYNSRGGNGDRWQGGVGRGGGRGYEDRDRGGYARNRVGFRGDVGRGYIGDNIGEGTVGFYGRTRRV